MTQSNSITELAKALSGFQGDMKNVVTDSVNPFFHSKYASLDVIWETIRPLLKKHGLALIQAPDGEGYLTSQLVHSSGEWILTSYKLILKELTPQGHGSALTYGRRYALSAILGISTEQDDDGNQATKPTNKIAQSPDLPPEPPEAIQYYESFKADNKVPCPGCGLPYGGKFKLCFVCNSKAKK